jgi:hypothetical protein
LVQDQAAGVLTLYLDGGLDKTSATGAETGVHGGWRIGATKPGQGGLKGEIAEVLLYDRALSVSEREQVEAYLTARWGLSASRTLEVTGVGRGGTQVEVVESGGWDVANATTVNVTTSFVRNPSFESGGIPSSPGYGSILAWSQTGAGGRNIAGMPFLGSAANGLIPDRDTVAFIQAAGTLSQTVYGLTPGQPYWLQFRYNLRDCCLASGNPPVMDLTVRFAGQALLTIPAIQPLATATAGELNYYFTNVVFTPASASGVLQFAATPVSGDASLLLDGVSIVQRGGGDVVLRNPSFEASGSPAGVGYIQPKLISGWTTELANWGVNIDGEGPFANNGVAQDQDLVLFFQGAGGYVSQNVSGLTAGAKHTLIFALNARQHASNVTRARVSFAGEVLLEEEVTPVGPLNPYHAKYLVFTPAGTEGELKFENASDPSMDSCVVLDNVRLVAGEVGPPVALEISMLPGDIVRLAWPSAATGYNLESAPALSGTWTAVSAQPVVEGNQWVVQLPLDTAPRFFRLKK